MDGQQVDEFEAGIMDFGLWIREYHRYFDKVNFLCVPLVGIGDINRI